MDEKWLQEIEAQQPYAYWLGRLHGIGNVTARRLLEVFGTPKAVYCATYRQLQEAVGTKVADRVKHDGEEEIFTAYMDLKNKEITLIPFYHPVYPKRLKCIPDGPAWLYVKGRMPSDERPSIAIVGARSCSEYGRYVAEHFAAFFAAQGVQIVSGMARGIDGIAEQAALTAGGDTYAVLGCGVDVCYPASHKELYLQTCQKGGLISEYPPQTPPLAGQFPARNRIISGLADGVLVVEARQKSGTLITVDMALEQGREIYVVPGRITDRLSDGCNRLLTQGANPALSPEQMLSELMQGAFCKYGLRVSQDKKAHREEKGPNRFNRQQSALYEILDFMPVSMEQIWLKAQQSAVLQGISLPGVMELLVELCMLGKVKNEGGYYCRSTP